MSTTENEAMRISVRHDLDRFRLGYGWLVEEIHRKTGENADVVTVGYAVTGARTSGRYVGLLKMAREVLDEYESIFVNR